VANLDINDFKNFIFVEGDDDFHFICNMMDIMNIKDVFVTKINGKTKLKTEIKAFKRLEAFKSAVHISIFLDADDSFESTRTSLIAQLNELGLPAPSNSMEIAEDSNGLKVSYFIMPGIDENGAIEDLLLKYCNKKAVMGKINAFFADLKCDENQIKSSTPDWDFPRNENKAKIQVFMSSHQESDTRIGTSLKKRIIDSDDDVFIDIRNYLQNIR